MTKTKKLTTEAKVHSTLTKDINRLRRHGNIQRKMNLLRKIQQRDMSKMIDWLLKEKRITKEELKRFLRRKKDVEKELKKELVK